MNNCILCNKQFKSKCDLVRHNNRKTSCVKEIIKCNNCLQVFKTNQILSRHINRKFQCEQVDLEKENSELKNQLAVARINNQIINYNTNNIIINNFGNEYIKSLDAIYTKKEFERILNNKLLFKPANYEVDNFKYTNEDIKDIDIFRLFVKLIFNNPKFPENKTLKYDDQTDKFYYYIDNTWLPFESKSNKLLIELIFEKIQFIIKESRSCFKENLNKLIEYVGDNYDIIVNEINSNDKHLLINSNTKKTKYITILKLDYMNKFNFHLENLKL